MVPIPRSVKERSTWSASGTAGVVSCHPRSDLRERRAQVVEAGAGPRARRHHRHTRNELLGLDARELERLLVDRVGLRKGDDAVLDPEQP